MTHKARLRWALVLGLLLLVSGSAIWILHWNSEEYAVYEAAIREGFSGEDVSYYVILDTTQPVGRFGISNFHSERLGLPLTARVSYTTKNLFRFHVPSKASPSPPVHNDQPERTGQCLSSRADGFPKRRRVEGASAEKLGCHYPLTRWV